MSDAVQRNARFDTADRLVRLGLFANLGLVAIKLSAGHFGQSDAVFADGLESACDLVVTIGMLVAMRVSRTPSDRRHPYGHGRIENIVALMIGALILATGGWILVSSGHALLYHAARRPTGLVVGAALFTVLIKELLARRTRRAGAQLGSPAIAALARDHRKDALSSIGTLAGAGLAMLGATFMDPIMAGISGLLILKLGWSAFVGASQELMDAALPEAQIRDITQLAESVAGVEHVHEIKGRRAGQFMIIDLKLDMDGAMSVRDSHALATRVKRLIFDAYPAVGDVMIHVNPHDDPDHEDLIRL